MTHGPYNVTNSHDPWAIQRCTTRCTTHGPWRIVLLYNPWVMENAFPMGHGLYNRYEGGTLPMIHGLYNTIPTPWPMGCTTLYPPHGTWVVQYCIYPWPMGCTVVSPLHGSWVVQHHIHSMTHGLYNTTYTPWSMGCTTG